MPWGVAAGVVGSVAGAAVSSAMSPSVSGGGSSYYTPTGLGSADTAWQQALGNNQIWTDLIDQTSQNSNQSLGLGNAAWARYGPGYQTAANYAGQGYTDAGAALAGLGNLDLATQQQLLGAGQQVYNMGLDPQSALYNRTAQQLQDQTGATNSMYGLGSSAAGAGVANQAMSNFNIDWQNNQLSRALQGLQGYTGAASTAGSYGQAGAQALTQAPGYTLMGGQVPYQTALGIAATPGQLGQTYTSQLQQGPFAANSGLQSSIIPYLNYGTGAQSVPFQSASQGAGALGSTVSQGIQGIGNAVQNSGGFSNLFSGTTGSFGGGDFSGAFNSSPYYSGGGNSYGFTLQ